MWGRAASTVFGTGVTKGFFKAQRRGEEGTGGRTVGTTRLGGSIPEADVKIPEFSAPGRRHYGEHPLLTTSECRGFPVDITERRLVFQSYPAKTPVAGLDQERVKFLRGGGGR